MPKIKGSIAAPAPKPEATGISLLSGLQEHEIDMLQRFLVILRNHGGCTTPIESLIWSLVLCYSPGCNLGPEDVDFEVKQFKEQFDDAIADTQRMLRDYRRFIEPPAPLVSVPENVGDEA